MSAIPPATGPASAKGITGGLAKVRHLIGERSETAAGTGESVFQPTRQNPAVVVVIDEIDEAGKLDGATKLLEFLASKQRKAAVCLILAGQRATVAWTGGSGVRVNLSTVVYGLLARDSEARHAVGAENELPDISEYSRGEAGYFGVYNVRAKRLVQRGRTFWMGKIGEQRDKIISRRDPAARPVLDLGTDGETTTPAPSVPREHPGSALRERLAHARELNEGHPLPTSTQPVPTGTGALPMVPGVPPDIAAGLARVLVGGALPASAAGQALGMSKSAAHRYLSALRDAEVVETTGTGCAIKWRLVGTAPATAPEIVSAPSPETGRYVTIAELAELAHAGRIPGMTAEQREVLEQVWQIAHRPRLTLIKGGEGDGQ